MRRRRPLMRAAMVGGGAYVAGKHVANNQAESASQEQRIADLEAQQAAAAPPAAAARPRPRRLRQRLPRATTSRRS